MYQVLWWVAAFDQMSEIVRANPSRKAEFSAALHQLVAILGSQSETTGESRAGPDRVWFFGPLTVSFRPIPDDRIVYVTSVWLHG